MSVLKHLIYCMLMMTCASALKAASTVFHDTTGDGLWQTALNWSMGSVPSSADSAVVNLGRVATVAVAAPAINTLVVGNNEFAGTELRIEADMTVAEIRVASSVASIGQITQSAGTLTCTAIFELASTTAGTDVGSYVIRGGSVHFEGVEMEVGTAGPARFVVEGSAVNSISGGDLTLGSEATMTLVLDTQGVTPVVLGGRLEIDPMSQLVVDGTHYEGLRGYFPLISTDVIHGAFSIEQVQFIGLEDREPALVVDADGLWLRILAPPTYAEQLCSLVPLSTVASDYSDTDFSVTRGYSPTGSAWTPTYDEAHVMDTRLFQEVTDGSAGAANRSWELTLGRGGQIASFRIDGSLGETVPPSWRSDTNSSPWQDEVWQGVAIDTSLNGAYDDAPYFIHQAGVYMNKDPALEQPFYSPQVAAYADEADRSFTTINWGQQAHLQIFINDEPADDWHSDVLYFTKVRDLGQGVIEVSLGFYNYGPDMPNYFNMPWGGVRRSSMEYAFFSDVSGSGWSAALEGGFGEGLSSNYDAVGGTIAWSDSVSGSSPALGLVFGFDPDPLLAGQTRSSLMRYGYAGGTDNGNEAEWRNYYVVSAIRRYELSQGRGVWARYYFVLGDDLSDLESRIEARTLADHATLTEFDYTEESSPLVGYTYSGSGPDFRIVQEDAAPTFSLYAHPVAGSFPIYEIIEADNDRYLTWNPYANNVIKTYDGTIASIRLLGFALPNTHINVGGTSYVYEPLDEVMAAATGSYLASEELLYVRVNSEIVLPDPVAHWSLDDVDGSVIADITGNGYDATVSGARSGVGVDGGAFYFDGDADAALIPVQAFSSVSDAISIAMWAYGGAAQPAKDSVFYAVNEAGDRVLNIHVPWESSRVYWDAGYADGYDRIDALAEAEAFKGKWNHWVFTKNAVTGNMRIYLNGVLWHYDSEKFNAISGITEAWFGSSHDVESESYDGWLDEVILYDVELSGAEVADLYRRYTLPLDYNAWLQDFPFLSDRTFAGDPELDGISTGLEYVLDGTPTNFDETILPTLDASGETFVFSFTRRADAVSFTEQVFEYSSDLLVWHAVNITVPRGGEVVLGAVANGVQAVTVKISKDLAVDGQLFGRLVVTSK